MVTPVYATATTKDPLYKFGASYGCKIFKDFFSSCYSC